MQAYPNLSKPMMIGNIKIKNRMMMAPMDTGFGNNAWPNLSTYFKFPQEVRRLIYTTNTGLHRIWDRPIGDDVGCQKSICHSSAIS